MKLRHVLLSLFLGGTALAIPVVLGVGGAGAMMSGCTPAEEAQVGTLGQLVLADVEAGKTLTQIEADVGTALFGSPTVTAQVVAIVNNVIQLLLNMAEAPTSSSPSAPANLTVSPNGLAAMKAMVRTLQAQMAASVPAN